MRKFGFFWALSIGFIIASIGIWKESIYGLIVGLWIVTMEMFLLRLGQMVEAIRMLVLAEGIKTFGLNKELEDIMNKQTTHEKAKETP